MEVAVSNILQPIDPLDISFSQEKCVKTPQTRKQSNISSPSYSKSLSKGPSTLFENKSTSSQYKRIMTPKISKFETVYKPAYRLPEIQMRGWSHNKYMSRKVIGAKPIHLGILKQGAHLKQIDKLDFLIKRVNARIQASRPYCKY